MQNKINKDELDEYGCFVKNDPSKNSNEKLDSLQSPEDDLQAFGVFVKPKKEGLLRRAEALRQKNEDEAAQTQESLLTEETSSVEETPSVEENPLAEEIGRAHV